MEVAARDHVALGHEHQRVVRHGVGFNLQHMRGVADLRQAGAHHLGLAAQGVRVLHLFAIGVRMAHFAVLAQQVAIDAGHGDLARLAARGVDACIEGHARTQHGFHAEAAAHQPGRHHVFGVEQAAQGVGRGHLRTVQQRQPFLGRQRQRHQAGARQRFLRGQPLALMARAAFAQQHDGHMRQRRQVTRGAHRAF
ncbi:hypothetical protein D3C72_1329990 [compost metagenome]